MNEDRVHLSRSGAGAGTHWAWLDEHGWLIVEWYDHGPNALYESANRLRFAPLAAAALLELNAPTGQEMLNLLQQRFGTFWDVRRAALGREIAFTTEADFLP